MPYSEIKRRIKLLRGSGYKRHRILHDGNFFKQWDRGDLHFRLMIATENFPQDYHDFIFILKEFEQVAEEELDSLQKNVNNR